MHNRSVSDPEINLKMYNMLQRVMVFVFYVAHILADATHKALELIVAQPRCPVRWSKCVKLWDGWGQRSNALNNKKKRKKKDNPEVLQQHIW